MKKRTSLLRRKSDHRISSCPVVRRMLMRGSQLRRLLISNSQLQNSIASSSQSRKAPTLPRVVRPVRPPSTSSNPTSKTSVVPRPFSKDDRVVAGSAYHDHVTVRHLHGFYVSILYMIGNVLFHGRNELVVETLFDNCKFIDRDIQAEVACT
jgi:hypothetical protein